ncbi:hypothetical protein RUM43_011084 [Polyplax serrata]|uniref:EF-hand domain-containing protein n=1 Tax=Polyplax serrata TaxID=468196 RepID=A0AAN8PU70_POLSC
MGRLEKRDEEYVGAVKLTSRERRFIKFASVEYDGQLYMTPQDFLESVVEQEPRPRLKRRYLTDKEVEKIKDQTPSLKKGSSEMFRKLRDKGIISYTEYLFLLSILTKPQSGFRIAFNMFDTDGNERVDKTEFLVVSFIVAHVLHDFSKPTLSIEEMIWKNKHWKKYTPEDCSRMSEMLSGINFFAFMLVEIIGRHTTKEMKARQCDPKSKTAVS